MSVNELAAASRESLRILLWQAVWAVVIAAAFAVTLGRRAGVSALVGSGIGLAWTVYMALTLFKHSLTHGARLSAVSFLAGWLIKVALTVCLLVIAFRSRAFAPLLVLAGLAGSMGAYWAWFALRVGRYAGGADGK